MKEARRVMLLLAAIVTTASPGIWAEETYTPHKPDTLTFNKDIAPIVFARCAGCHHAAAAESPPFPFTLEFPERFPTA